MTAQIGSTILNAASIVNDRGTVTSLGHNLSSDGGGGFLTATGDQTNTNPMLGPLQDNGGPTFTHALMASSPAIDKGKNFSGSATDQRANPRTFDDPNIANASGGGTDIGAVEMNMTGGPDADLDGMPDDYEIAHGLNPDDAGDASLDSDGDGLNNLQEFLAGTDPNDSRSTLRITLIEQFGDDVRITWTTAGGRTNRLQATTGTTDGDYSNNFVDAALPHKSSCCPEYNDQSA